MLISPVTQRLQAETGLDLTDQHTTGALRQAMRLAGDSDLNQFAEKVLRDPRVLQEVIDQVVVPETWFFRDPEAFTVAVQWVRARLAAGRAPVRILCAPCASGEEPYSLAMALRDQGVAATDVRIEGIDISRRVIDLAQRAVYQRNAFRASDLSFRARHFERQDQGYRLRPEIARMVAFRQANLLTLEPAAASFDVIFCRNLLIYFDEATCAAAVAKLGALLADDGLLFSGYAEQSIICQHGFNIAAYPQAFALRKNTVHATTPLPAAVSPRRDQEALPATLAAVPASFLQNSIVPQPTATRLANADPEALLQTARIQADLGQTADALAGFNRYLELVPDSAEAHFMLGLLSEQSGQSAAAQSYLRRAVYLEPNHYDALCHLAMLVDQGGNAAGAAQLRQRAARVVRRQDRSDA